MPTGTRNTSTAVVVAEEPRPIAVLRQDLEQRASDLETLLRVSGMDTERFIRVSLMAIAKSPDLLDCTRESIVVSIIEAAQVGLEPTGGIGGAWLVPFREKGGPRKAQLIYDYRGVQHLIREGGGGEVSTTLVYEGDSFKVLKGTSPRIEHEPAFKTIDPAKITFVYAIPLDYPDKFEVMTKEDIDRIRARSKSANSGPWVTDYGAQARKTVLKRISAWLPLKPKYREALEIDTEREIATPAATATVSRTAEVRNQITERIASRGRADVAVVTEGDVAAGRIDPAAAAARGVDVIVTPDASATEQPTTADEATDGVCGATSDPQMPPVEACVLEAGHEGADKKPSPHKAASGAVWPNGGAK